MEEDLLARDTGFNFPQPTVVTGALFRTSRNLSIKHDCWQQALQTRTRFFKPEPHAYNNRDTQLPEQLSPISTTRRSLLDTYSVSVVAHGIYITNTTTLSSTVLGGARANTSFGGQARPDEYRARRARSPWSPGDVQPAGSRTSPRSHSRSTAAATASQRRQQHQAPPSSPSVECSGRHPHQDRPPRAASLVSHALQQQRRHHSGGSTIRLRRCERVGWQR